MFSSTFPITWSVSTSRTATRDSASAADSFGAAKGKPSQATATQRIADFDLNNRPLVFISFDRGGCGNVLPRRPGQQERQPGAAEHPDAQRGEASRSAVIIHLCQPADDVRSDETAKIAKGVHETHDHAHDAARQRFAGNCPKWRHRCEWSGNCQA